MRGYLSFLLVISFLAISLNFIHSFLYYKTFSQDKAIAMESAYQSGLDYKALTKAYATGATIAATSVYLLHVTEKATENALKCGEGFPLCFPVEFVSNFKIDELKSYIKKSVAFSSALVWLQAMEGMDERRFKVFPWCGPAPKSELKTIAMSGGDAKNNHPFPTPSGAVNGWGSDAERLVNYFECESAVDVEVSFDPEKAKALKVHSYGDVDDYINEFTRLLSIDVFLGSGGAGGVKRFGYTIYNKYYNYGKAAYYPREDYIHIGMKEVVDNNIGFGDVLESELVKTGFTVEKAANYTK